MPPRKTSPLTPSTPLTADHRARLVALRDKLTAELDAAPAAYVAAIARQLQAVLAELASHRDPDEGPSTVDILRAKRMARLAAAGRAEAP